MSHQLILKLEQEIEKLSKDTSKNNEIEKLKQSISSLQQESQDQIEDAEQRKQQLELEAEQKKQQLD